MTEMTKGTLAMIAACGIWGVFPLYFAQLAHLPPVEVLAHRVIWSALVFAALIALTGRARELGTVLSTAFWRVLLAALMISANWGVFIYAVGQGRATEASLGYYLFPILAVAFGAALFRERPTPLQWAAVALAAAAVAVLATGLGAAPWLAMSLSVTFVLYGVLKRWLKVNPVLSVTAEVIVLWPAAVALLIWLGGGAGPAGGLRDIGLLIISGPITVVPLMLFSYATRRVAYGTVGVTQYVNPTLQLACAVLVLGEPFDPVRQLAFAMIWGAVLLYSIAALRASRRAGRKASTVGTIVK